MKKRILATLMILLLSAAMLAGCGDSGSSRSSRDSDKSSSKSSSSSKKDYESDVDALMEMSEDLYAEFAFVYVSGASDYYDLADVLSDAAKALNVKTSEGKQIKSDIQKMAKFYESIGKCIEREDVDGLSDINDEWEDFLDDFDDHVNDFIDSAEDQGVDEDDLEDLADAIESFMYG